MTRNYSKVSDDKRKRLIDMINSKMTIKDAARIVDIKYENAKAIYRVYRREQRTDKRRNRFRYKLPAKQSSCSSDDSSIQFKQSSQRPERPLQTRSGRTIKRTIAFDEDENALKHSHSRWQDPSMRDGQSASLTSKRAMMRHKGDMKMQDSRGKSMQRKGPNDGQDGDFADDDDDHEGELDSAQDDSYDGEKSDDLDGINHESRLRAKAIHQDPSKIMIQSYSKAAKKNLEQKKSNATILGHGRMSHLNVGMHAAQGPDHKVGQMSSKMLSGHPMPQIMRVGPQVYQHLSQQRLKPQQLREHREIDETDCQVQIQNMTPFSEQSSQFLQAKNLSLQSVVQGASNLEERPIKYGDAFFGLLNKKDQGLQTKPEVKANYEAKYADQHAKYLELMRTYNQAYGEDLQLAQNHSQEIQSLQSEAQKMQLAQQMNAHVAAKNTPSNMAAPNQLKFDDKKHGEIGQIETSPQPGLQNLQSQQPQKLMGFQNCDNKSEQPMQEGVSQNQWESSPDKLNQDVNRQQSGALAAMAATLRRSSQGLLGQSVANAGQPENQQMHLINQGNQQSGAIFFGNNRAAFMDTSRPQEPIASSSLYMNMQGPMTSQQMPADFIQPGMQQQLYKPSQYSDIMQPVLQLGTSSFVGGAPGLNMKLSNELVMRTSNNQAFDHHQQALQMPSNRLVSNNMMGPQDLNNVMHGAGLSQKLTQPLMHTGPLPISDYYRMDSNKLSIHQMPQPGEVQDHQIQSRRGMPTAMELQSKSSGGDKATPATPVQPIHGVEIQAENHPHQIENQSHLEMLGPHQNQAQMSQRQSVSPSIRSEGGQPMPMGQGFLKPAQYQQQKQQLQQQQMQQYQQQQQQQNFISLQGQQLDSIIAQNQQKQFSNYAKTVGDLKVGNQIKQENDAVSKQADPAKQMQMQQVPLFQDRQAFNQKSDQVASRVSNQVSPEQVNRVQSRFDTKNYEEQEQEMKAKNMQSIESQIRQPPQSLTGFIQLMDGSQSQVVSQGQPSQSLQNAHLQGQVNQNSLNQSPDRSQRRESESLRPVGSTIQEQFSFRQSAAESTSGRKIENQKQNQINGNAVNAEESSQQLGQIKHNNTIENGQSQPSADASQSKPTPENAVRLPYICAPALERKKTQNSLRHVQKREETEYAQGKLEANRFNQAQNQEEMLKFTATNRIGMQSQEQPQIQNIVQGPNDNQVVCKSGELDLKNQNQSDNQLYHLTSAKQQIDAAQNQAPVAVREAIQDLKESHQNMQMANISSQKPQSSQLEVPFSISDKQIYMSMVKEVQQRGKIEQSLAQEKPENQTTNLEQPANQNLQNQNHSIAQKNNQEAIPATQLSAKQESKQPIQASIPEQLKQVRQPIEKMIKMSGSSDSEGEESSSYSAASDEHQRQISLSPSKRFKAAESIPQQQQVMQPVNRVMPAPKTQDSKGEDQQAAQAANMPPQLQLENIAYQGVNQVNNLTQQEAHVIERTKNIENVEQYPNQAQQNDAAIQRASSKLIQGQDQVALASQQPQQIPVPLNPYNAQQDGQATLMAADKSQNSQLQTEQVQPVEGGAMPSQVLKYLLNQLEQMNLKLQMLGYQQPKDESNGPLSQKFQVQDVRSQSSSIEQALKTIENFGNEVISMHLAISSLQSSNEPAARGLLSCNVRMLSSLTQLVQVMWSELNRMPLDSCKPYQPQITPKVPEEAPKQIVLQPIQYLKQQLLQKGIVPTESSQQNDQKSTAPYQQLQQYGQTIQNQQSGQQQILPQHNLIRSNSNVPLPVNPIVAQHNPQTMQPVQSAQDQSQTMQKIWPTSPQPPQSQLSQQLPTYQQAVIHQSSSTVAAQQSVIQTPVPPQTRMSQLSQSMQEVQRLSQSLAQIANSLANPTQSSSRIQVHNQNQQPQAQIPRKQPQQQQQQQPNNKLQSFMQIYNNPDSLNPPQLQQPQLQLQQQQPQQPQQLLNQLQAQPQYIQPGQQPKSDSQSRQY